MPNLNFTEIGFTFLIAYGPILIINYLWNHYHWANALQEALANLFRWMEEYTRRYNEEQTAKTITERPSSSAGESDSQHQTQ